MTIEEALYYLDTIPTIGEQVDALEMAIKALEQETCDMTDTKRIEGLELTISKMKAQNLRLISENRQLRYKPEQKWIPVSERLPEKGKQVLCCNKQGSVFTSAITYRSACMITFGQHCDVIAWMPLPEPYKAESEE